MEIKHLLGKVAPLSYTLREEICVDRGHIKKFNTKQEKMQVEDMAALEKLTEEKIVDELKVRMDQGKSYSFIGDVLLSLNSGDLPKELPKNVCFLPQSKSDAGCYYNLVCPQLIQIHNKYISKSRSENAPHIFAVADSAYQDMLHHEETQHIIMSGESMSGKTTNVRLALQHLTVLGEGNAQIKERVMKAQDLVHYLTNAGTPLNPDSTRCVLQTQVTFTKTGKLSGAIFWPFLLEKSRVSSTDT